MNLRGFWKRGKKSKEKPQQQKKTQTPAPERSFATQKHQKLVLRESRLCLTVPQKAVAALHISTKRFIEWQRHTKELHGHLFMSETTHTTRIEQLAHSDQYIAIVPASLVSECGLKAGNDGGSSGICEWDDQTLRIRIPLSQKPGKKTKHRG
ncbi:MAG: hypothetical protein GY801_27605 [bacterium]|nr:hypothetical protein [bacterium]